MRVFLATAMRRTSNSFLSLALFNLLACGADEPKPHGPDASTSSTTSGSGPVETTAGDPGDSSGGATTTAADETTATTKGDASGSETAEQAGLQVVDDVYFTPQGTPFTTTASESLLLNDTPPTGQMISVASADARSVEGGTVAVSADGTFAYTPVEGFWGPDSFSYTVASDDGEMADASASIYVTPVNVPLAEVALGHGGFAIDGDIPGGLSAVSVSAAGDFDGDGQNDVVVGAPLPGRADVVFGGGHPDAVSLADIVMGNGGVSLLGPPFSGDLTGGRVAPAGDVDGDGIDDVLVGAHYFDNEVGRTYVVFGRAGNASVNLLAVAAGDGGFVIDGEVALDRAGTRLSPAGDVDGDGLADILVSTWRDVLDTLPERAYVVFGKADGDPVSLTGIGAGGGFIIRGETPGDGIDVSRAGDLDGDGLDDIVISAESVDVGPEQNNGRVYIVFGKPDTDAIVLGDVASQVGGYAIDGGFAGAAITGAGVGDVDGDGLPDFIVREPTGPDATGLGRTYVIFGTGDAMPPDLDGVASGVGGFVIDGAIPGENAAYTAAAGDVNGDGLADLVVSGAFDSPTVPFAYVVFGKSDTEPVDLGDVAQGQGGYVVEREPGADRPFATTARDFDGDGVADLVFGDPHFSGNLGRAWVVYGVRTVP